MKTIALFIFLLSTLIFVSFQAKPKFDLKASMTKGKDIYTSYCMSCHMENGEGFLCVLWKTIKQTARSSVR